LLEPTSHARSAWWLETEAYAPIALERASTALADSRGAKPKNFLSFLFAAPPPPLRLQGEKEGKEIFGLLRRYQTFR